MPGRGSTTPPACCPVWLRNGYRRGTGWNVGPGAGASQGGTEMAQEVEVEQVQSGVSTQPGNQGRDLLDDRCGQGWVGESAGVVPCASAK